MDIELQVCEKVYQGRESTTKEKPKKRTFSNRVAYRFSKRQKERTSDNNSDTKMGYLNNEDRNVQVRYFPNSRGRPAP
jgi:hypothetical protein